MGPTAVAGDLFEFPAAIGGVLGDRASRGFSELGFGFVCVDFFSRDGVGGEDGQTVVDHLDESAFDEIGAARAFRTILVGEIESEFAEAEFGDDWGAIGKDAEEPVPCGDHSLADLVFKDAVAGGDELALDGGHGRVLLASKLGRTAIGSRGEQVRDLGRGS